MAGKRVNELIAMQETTQVPASSLLARKKAIP
jgi:hypothetical protein